MNAFESVSYADYASRFVRLDKALKLDNPLGIDVDQARNMHKAVALSYLSLDDNMTVMQKVNAPLVMNMASLRLIDFEIMLASEKQKGEQQ